MKNNYKRLLFSMLGIGLMASTFFAAAVDSIELIISNHKFQPAEITIPARTKVKLVVKNQDATPEEFESHALHREKVIPGGAERTIFIGPLEPGSYEFFGEFNPKTAKGRVIVK